MEVSCSVGRQGSLDKRDVCNNSLESVTGLNNNTDIDQNILSETSDVLNKIVDTTSKDSNAASNPEHKDNTKPRLLKTFLYAGEGITELNDTDNINETDSILSDSAKNLGDSEILVDEYTVINNETRESAVLPFTPLTLDSEETRNKVHLEKDNCPKLLNANQTGDVEIPDSSALNKEPLNSKADDNSFKEDKKSTGSKKIITIKKKPKRRKQSSKKKASVIDLLFDAAQKGDKDDFKRILYVNYDNIVNENIDSSQSDSCASGEGWAQVTDTLEICDPQVSGHVTEQSDQELSTQISGQKEKSNGLDSELQIDKSHPEKISVSDIVQFEASKNKRIRLKRKTSNVKEVSRVPVVAVKKLKTTPAKPKTVLKTGPINSEENDEDFVDVITVKKEVDSEDYFASSELDDSISQREAVENNSVEGTSEVDSTQDKELQFVCQHCQKRYRNLVHLRSHQTQHHIYESSFTCEACSKIFPSLDKLKQHENVHVIIEKTYCELCKKLYSSNAAIRRHAQTVHVVEKKRPHLCEICDFAFTCRWHLREHLRIHTGKHEYPCPVCKRPFSHVGSMNRHAKEQHNFDTTTGQYFKDKPKKARAPDLRYSFKKVKVISPTGCLEEVVGVPKDNKPSSPGTVEVAGLEGVTIKTEPVDPNDP